MSKQLSIFSDLIPPCKHCGGKGEWKDAGKSSLGVSEPLERLACTRCTFETDRMVLKRRAKGLEYWIAGVPRLVIGTYTKKYLTVDEYYAFFSRMTPRPTTRYMGTVYCMAGC